MKNYSKQREAIAEVLRKSKAHPTAAQVYSEVRKTLPNISLGTVYRNLSELSKSGSILDISVGDGSDHFDGDITPHLHLYCVECGAIEDVPINGDPLYAEARAMNFSPENLICVLNGVCKNCNDKKIKNKE